jgi:predicted aminopeptidase
MPTSGPSKARILAELRASHAALKAGPWAGFAGYDAWFERANNASLAVQAAYDELVPGFERLFRAEGATLGFYASVSAIGRLAEGRAAHEQTAHRADDDPDLEMTAKCPT